MTDQDHSKSNIKDHWSQITIKNIIVIKMFEILQELPKFDTEKIAKWANPVGKMVPVDSLHAGLPQTFNL